VSTLTLHVGPGIVLAVYTTKRSQVSEVTMRIIATLFTTLAITLSVPARAQDGFCTFRGKFEFPGRGKVTEQCVSLLLEATRAAKIPKEDVGYTLDTVEFLYRFTRRTNASCVAISAHEAVVLINLWSERRKDRDACTLTESFVRILVGIYRARPAS
jgi:hypothetical protein